MVTHPYHEIPATTRFNPAALEKLARCKWKYEEFTITTKTRTGKTIQINCHGDIKINGEGIPLSEAQRSELAQIYTKVLADTANEELRRALGL